MTDAVGGAAAGELLWKVFVDGVGAGVYLVFAVLQLDLWFRRRWRSHLWLAGAALAALAVDLSGLAIHVLGVGTPALGAANSLAVAAATVCLSELVPSLEDQRPGGAVRFLEVLVLVLAPVAGLVGTWLARAVMAGIVLLLLAAATEAVRAGLRGGREFRAIALGFTVLAALLVLDLVRLATRVEMPYGMPIVGFAALFFGAAHTLNLRFARAEEAARTDPLTGLGNRRWFLEIGRHAAAVAQRSGEPLSVVMGDVDRFKQINDRYGHACGDAVLRSVASLLEGSTRQQDPVARWGGDEFVLLLPGTDEAGARRLAESLGRRLAEERVDGDGVPIAVSLSMGVAEHRPEDRLEATIQRADRDLYEAKGRRRRS